MASNYIKISSFEEFNNALEAFESTINQISELFTTQNNLFAQLEHSDFWISESQKKFCEKYNELKSKYESINQSLESYQKLAKDAYDKYLANNELSNNQLNSNSSSYDV